MRKIFALFALVATLGIAAAGGDLSGASADLGAAASNGEVIAESAQTVDPRAQISKGL